MAEPYLDPQGCFISPESAEVSSEIEHDFRKIESVSRLDAIHRQSQYSDTLLDKYGERIGNVDSVGSDAVKEQAVLLVRS